MQTNPVITYDPTWTTARLGRLTSLNKLGLPASGFGIRHSLPVFCLHHKKRTPRFAGGVHYEQTINRNGIRITYVLNLRLWLIIWFYLVSVYFVGFVIGRVEPTGWLTMTQPQPSAWAWTPHSSQTTRTRSWHKYLIHTRSFHTMSSPAPFFASSSTTHWPE